MALMFPTVLLVVNISSIAVVLVGAPGGQRRGTQIGALTAFLAYLMQIVMAVMMATFMFMMVPRTARCGVTRDRAAPEVAPGPGCLLHPAGLHDQRGSGAPPAAIVAPGGQRTTLDRDANGWLSRIENPAGEAATATYPASGLMSRFTDPRGGVHDFEYGADGLPTREEGPGGRVQTLRAPRSTAATG